MRDDSKPTPEPNFSYLLQYPQRTEIKNLFDEIGGDRKLSSFVKSGVKANQATTAGEAGTNTLHAILRAIGSRYGELLLPAEKELDVSDSRNFMRMITLQEHPETITLYLGRKTDHPASFSIPNRINGIDATLDELLFLVGQASSEVKSRSRENHGYMSNRLGGKQGIQGGGPVILERMEMIYKHIYQSLRDQGIGEEQIQRMMKESELDINQHTLQNMLGSISGEFKLSK